MNESTKDLGFLNQLEAATLPPAAFDHEGHVHAAWVCFRQDSSEHAETRFIAALKRYAASLGQAGKYHATITLALLHLIRCRMADAEATESWGAFAQRNPDLLENAMGLLEHHYSPECLASDQARNEYLEPDRSPLPELAATA